VTGPGSGFDRLHPAVQHHVVNGLGWRTLRPLQDAAVEPIVAGDHALLVAATAAGKTEAALLPLLSRMLEHEWRGLTVLYVCPIKALLNDLEPRLQRLAGFVGRRAAVWHGDVGASARRRLVAEPPDLLLTTPESLEAMLIFRRADRDALFARLQAVVIDELHAFAGDDRGWHLLAVLERLTAVAGRDLQRVGLSATVGNPGELVTWLAGSSTGPRKVVAVDGPRAEADLCLDWVGSLDNAALVISRLHRGEKRLVFCDSRSRVEQLAQALRGHGVRVHVSHGSLGLDERRRAEEAFREGRDCVIVATSALELGLDVGDLDRTLQIDAPSTVAAFLQRLGRTGRRPGTTRNCLILATRPPAFLQAAAILSLVHEGWVEPVTPPPEPLHLFAQQLLALVLERGQVGRALVPSTPAGAFARLAGIAPADQAAVVEHLVTSGLLQEDAGMLSFGPTADVEFAGRRMLELCSAFVSPPLFTVLHGREPLGTVHETTFHVRDRDGAPIVLLLGGRSWAVRSVDWSRRTAWVEAVEADGRSRWQGEPVPLHARLGGAIRRVLATGEVPYRLTQRAQEQLETLRREFAWVEDGTTAFVREEGQPPRWWTFAGLRANRVLAAHLPGLSEPAPRADNLHVRLSPCTDAEALRAAIALLPQALEPAIDLSTLAGLKFSECLPDALATRVLLRRESDHAGVQRCISAPLRTAILGTITPDCSDPARPPR
jgi:ATP-dependent helicase Lhr and Lhr-like helicase